MNDMVCAVAALSDGKRTSIEIAAEVGLSPRYVRRLQVRHNFPRLNVGARPGTKNHRYVAGRRICRDGYVHVDAPEDHPYARKRTNRPQKMIAEHRLALEKKMGRYLLPQEVVDHIDGLSLHNAPDNLRLFGTNASHLKETITNSAHLVCTSGRKNISVWGDHGKVTQRYDTYRLRKESGDVRLRQILLAALSLGIDNPYLSGTHHWLGKAGIDHSQRSSLKRALVDLDHEWALLLLR